jgi:prepilin-type N-terminal cleavage/methylation domain-containing protein
MRGGAPGGGFGPAGGFTLIELLLTLVLLLLLLGAVVINFTGLQTGVQLDEGAEQFESLIRYARAHAANTGCKVRVTFEEVIDEDIAIPLGNVFVSWEPEPLTRPGEFLPLTELSPLTDSLLGLVEVEDVRPLGTQAIHPLPEGEGDVAASFAPITFYPDGSSDSAEIVLAARDLEDDRRLALRIIGTTGTVKRHNVSEMDASGVASLPGESNAN